MSQQQVLLTRIHELEQALASSQRQAALLLELSEAVIEPGSLACDCPNRVRICIRTACGAH